MRSDGELGRTGKEEDQDRERITVKRQAEPAVAEAGAAVGENAAAAPWPSLPGVHQTVLCYYYSLRLSLFFLGLLGVSPVYKELTKA